MADRAAPVPLFALLEHPLVRAGEARAPWLERARALELGLRGWVEARTHHPLGYVEQLYTFADRDRTRDGGGHGRGRRGCSGGNQKIDVPFTALAAITVPTYQPDACPLCAQGIPVVKPGSRAV